MRMIFSFEIAMLKTNKVYQHTWEVGLDQSRIVMEIFHNIVKCKE